MKKLTLPFYHEFFQIVENNEILNWRARDFVQAILGDTNNFSEKERQLVYRGLSILVAFKYLKREKCNGDKKSYFYSETIRLKVHKEKVQYLRIKDKLVIEKQEIEKLLEQNKIEHTFILDIVYKHPDLRVFFEKYDVCISKRIEEMETKIIFIKSVLNDIEIL